MKSISTLSLIPMILFLSLTAAELKEPTTSTTNTNATNLISKACEKLSDEFLCLSVLNADPTAKTADLKGLAFIALKTAENTATNTSTHIKSLLGKGSPDSEDDLSSCAESYVNVVDQINDSLDSLVTKNYKNVNLWINAAMVDVSECNVNVKDHASNSIKELAEMNRHLKDLCKNALEVVQVLAGNQA